MAESRGTSHDLYLCTESEREEIQKALSTYMNSFATHLMEQGVARQNIQALFGHRDPKSTEIYLHVSNKSLMGSQSQVHLTGKKVPAMNNPTVQDIFQHFYPAYLENILHLWNRQKLPGTS